MSSKEQIQGPLYPAKRFSGSLSFKEHRVSCTLTAEIGNDGRLTVHLDPIRMNESSAFLHHAWDPGAKFPLFSLEAISDDDDRLSSDEFFFTNPSAGTNKRQKGSYFAFSGFCGHAKIVGRRENDDGAGRLTWLLRGFRGFRPLRVGTKYGELTLAGLNRNDPTKIGGDLRLKTTSEAISSEETRRELNDFFEHVVWIMSFASGTLIKDPVRLFEHGNEIEMEVRRVSASPSSGFPSFHFTNFQPIFEQAVSSYFSRHKECEEIRPVIEFILIDTKYVDVRLMAAAISLEYLANRHLDQDGMRQKDSTRFCELYNNLHSILSTSNMSSRDKKFVKQAVKRGNNLSLEEKVKKTIKKLQICMFDLPDDIIANIVTVRYS